MGDVFHADHGGAFHDLPHSLEAVDEAGAATSKVAHLWGISFSKQHTFFK